MFKKLYWLRWLNVDMLETRSLDILEKTRDFSHFTIVRWSARNLCLWILQVKYFIKYLTCM